uniref:Putative secreted protein n=1 Tax=Anopheles darlingi TaxID=43151 RepID=A0A2M4DIZ5_ANODA
MPNTSFHGVILQIVLVVRPIVHSAVHIGETIPRSTQIVSGNVHKICSLAQATLMVAQIDSVTIHWHLYSHFPRTMASVLEFTLHLIDQQIEVILITCSATALRASRPHPNDLNTIETVPLHEPYRAGDERLPRIQR